MRRDVDEIEAFWDEQAKTHGTSDLATAPDHYYRQLEMNCIAKRLKLGDRVLDVGCGNGYSTEFFSKLVSGTYTGMDYSEEMIRLAQSRGSAKLHFTHGNAVLFPKEIADNCFDTVISTRCLINLRNWDEQQFALLEMKSVLPKGGRIILVENFVDGLDNLNRLREDAGLDEIEQRWHNRYMRLDAFYPFINQHFYIEERDNIGNLYYIISRVVYAAEAKRRGEEISYDHPMNRLASRLPTLGAFDSYSPNFLFVLRVK